MKIIIDYIKNGLLVVLKTDTLYGIIASAFNKNAVEKIYKIKKRNNKKPFIILISNIEQLRLFEISLDKRKISFLKKYWPGPVSIILPVKSNNFFYLHKGKKTLAFRIPDNAFLQELIIEVGPLVAPSANPEGKPPARNKEESFAYFGDSVDFYKDDGVCKEKKASKIILLQDNLDFKILRK